jgi:hypothetical protein
MELDLFAKLRVLMREPFRYLVSSIVELAGAICNVEDRERIFGGDLLGNSESPTTWSRDGTASLVTVQLRQRRGSHIANRDLRRS